MTNFNRYLAICSLFCFTPKPAAAADFIEDNSFLIEEAYNQEPGDVQHIDAFAYHRAENSWENSFTQEWPLFSKAHQLAYSVPVSRVSDPESSAGIGDIELSYRYQIVDRSELALAPDFSLALPTGDPDKGLGNDVVTYGLNLPLSIVLNERVVTHLNAGLSYASKAQSADGATADISSFNYGASVVYHVSNKFDALLEISGGSDESVSGKNQTSREESLFLVPGMRFAFDFDSGLQIVPGVGILIGIGESNEDWGAIGYLSFEHPFI